MASSYSHKYNDAMNRVLSVKPEGKCNFFLQFSRKKERFFLFSSSVINPDHVSVPYYGPLAPFLFYEGG